MAESPASPLRTVGSWSIVWGVLLILAGVLAIMQPAIAALALNLLLGWLLVFAGVFEIAAAIHERGKDGFRLKLLLGILTLVLGAFLLFQPLKGIASIALMIGAIMFAHGVSGLMLAFNLKPRKGWGWVLIDGVLSIVIAALIALGWPESSYRFVGILVGIGMMYGGVWRIVLGRALREGPPVAVPKTAAA